MISVKLEDQPSGMEGMELLVLKDKDSVTFGKVRAEIVPQKC